MVNFSKLEFKLTARKPIDPRKLSDALNKLGGWRFSNTSARTVWGDTIVTGEADKLDSINSLAKALKAQVDETTYHFNFKCDGRTTRAQYAEMQARSRSLSGVKVKFDYNKQTGHIYSAWGTAPSEQAIVTLKGLTGGR